MFWTITILVVLAKATLQPAVTGVTPGYSNQMNATMPSGFTGTQAFEVTTSNYPCQNWTATGGGNRTTGGGKARDCYELKLLGVTLSGVYEIWLNGSQRGVNVFCDMTTDGGGWTVFQRRVRGCQDFYNGWNYYAYGFGKLELEFWLGNDVVFSMLDMMTTYTLRVDLTDFNGKTPYAVYNNFRIASSSDKYRLLSLGKYSGTAGDAMSVSVGFRFSTFDSDNDVCSDSNSAARFHGGWWYVSADYTYANLNGFYYGGKYTSSTNDGVIWIPFKGASYSLKSTEMKFRPNFA